MLDCTPDEVWLEPDLRFFANTGYICYEMARERIGAGSRIAGLVPAIKLGLVYKGHWRRTNAPITWH